MEVRFIKALWGMDTDPLGAALEQIRQAGYDGFEAPLGIVRAAGERTGELDFVSMLFEEDPASLAEGVAASAEAGAVAVNVHAGKDHWTFEAGCRFFEAALRIVDASPVPVTFETHRGRLLYSPASTAEYLRRFPELRITADFSHWTCVCESMLEDQGAAVNLAVSRTDYLHARVGHEEGPQVPDPRVAPWNRHVECFEVWWDAIVDRARVEKRSVLRVDPEFGPPNYLWTDPRSGEPMSDLWDICLWMRDRLRARWS